MEDLYAKVRDAVCKDIERVFGVLQGKWNIISCPLKFLTINSMEIFMILIEERHVEELVHEVENDTDVADGSGMYPMWIDLVRLTGQSAIPPDLGVKRRSVRRLCICRTRTSTRRQRTC